MSETTLRVVIGGLAVAFVVIVAAAITVLLSQPGPGRASPSPSLSAAPSPPASASPTPTPTPTVAPSSLTPPPVSPTEPPATPPPTASPTPTLEPAPTAGPTEAPSIVPTGPQREMRIVGLGLDGPGPETPVRRLVTFVVDGPSEIAATLSDVTAGQVEMCLWLGDADNVLEQECQTSGGGQLVRSIVAPGQTTWTVSLIGATAGTSPSVSLAIAFNALVPGVTLDLLRFQGTDIENYNGLTAEIPMTAAGQLDLAASFDDGAGGLYPYRLVVERLGDQGGVVHNSTGGPTDSIELSQTVSAGRTYRLTLENTQQQAGQQVFLRATLTWP